MTGEDFKKWLAAVKRKKIASTDAEAGALIGRTPTAVLRIKTAGCDHTLALACAAVLNGLPPYPKRARKAVAE